MKRKSVVYEIVEAEHALEVGRNVYYRDGYVSSLPYELAKAHAQPGCSHKKSGQKYVARKVTVELLKLPTAKQKVGLPEYLQTVQGYVGKTDEAVRALEAITRRVEQDAEMAQGVVRRVTKQLQTGKKLPARLAREVSALTEDIQEGLKYLRAAKSIVREREEAGRKTLRLRRKK